VTAILIGLIVYLWFRPPAFVDELAYAAPDVATLPGQRLSDLHGKVVLVNFWATWCPYCRHEMPAMQAFYQENQAKGFEIVAYSLDKTQTEVDAFMRAEGYSFPAPLATKKRRGIRRCLTRAVVFYDRSRRHRASQDRRPGACRPARRSDHAAASGDCGCACFTSLSRRSISRR
jgi:thiol-disulfide isomerase/thioredoxin